MTSTREEHVVNDEEKEHHTSDQSCPSFGQTPSPSLRRGRPRVSRTSRCCRKRLILLVVVEHNHRRTGFQSSLATWFLYKYLGFNSLFVRKRPNNTESAETTKY